MGILFLLSKYLYCCSDVVSKELSSFVKTTADEASYKFRVTGLITGKFLKPGLKDILSLRIDRFPCLFVKNRV